MGFFSALSPLLAQGALSVRISKADDGKVKILIIQDASEDAEAGVVPLPPLRHVDSPERLDETIETEIAALAEYRIWPVQSVLDEAKALIDDAAAEEKRQAQERLAKSRSKQGTSRSTVRSSAGTGEGNGSVGAAAKGAAGEDVGANGAVEESVETASGSPHSQPAPVTPQLFD